MEFQLEYYRFSLVFEVDREGKVLGLQVDYIGGGVFFCVIGRCVIM